jgi:hypothetical protein
MLVRRHDFADFGPNSTVAQVKTAAGHTRTPTTAATKLVRCARGAIVDVEVRPRSQTVCRTRLLGAGQQGGSGLRGELAWQAGQGNPQNRRHDLVWVGGAEPQR